jgi:hypothetical protein
MPAEKVTLKTEDDELKDKASPPKQSEAAIADIP